MFSPSWLNGICILDFGFFLLAEVSLRTFSFAGFFLLREKFLTGELIMLCPNCHSSFDKNNIKSKESGKIFNLKEMQRRFKKLQDKVGISLLDDFEQKISTTIFTHGTFLKETNEYFSVKKKNWSESTLEF